MVALAQKAISYGERRILLEKHKWDSSKSSLVILLGVKDGCVYELRVCLFLSGRTPLCVLGLWDCECLVCEFISWYWDVKFVLGVMGFVLASVCGRFWLCLSL